LISARFHAILRAPMRGSLAGLAVLALTACGSPCQDLGHRICLCQPAGALRDACNKAVQDQIGSGNPKPHQSEQDFCESKLSTCPNPSTDGTACDRQQTAEGKIACGLAYNPDETTTQSQ
jgi:hypothetical protein